MRGPEGWGAFSRTITYRGRDPMEKGVDVALAIDLTHGSAATLLHCSTFRRRGCVNTVWMPRCTVVRRTERTTTSRVGRHPRPRCTTNTHLHAICAGFDLFSTVFRGTFGALTPISGAPSRIRIRPLGPPWGYPKYLVQMEIDGFGSWTASRNPWSTHPPPGWAEIDWLTIAVMVLPIGLPRPRLWWWCVVCSLLHLVPPDPAWSPRVQTPPDVTPPCWCSAKKRCGPSSSPRVHRGELAEADDGGVGDWRCHRCDRCDRCLDARLFCRLALATRPLLP
jgi:hypothetical protein